MRCWKWTFKFIVSSDEPTFVSHLIFLASSDGPFEISSRAACGPRAGVVQHCSAYAIRCVQSILSTQCITLDFFMFLITSCVYLLCTSIPPKPTIMQLAYVFPL